MNHEGLLEAIKKWTAENIPQYGSLDNMSLDIVGNMIDKPVHFIITVYPQGRGDTQ